jgi:hypothetical protein
MTQMDGEVERLALKIIDGLERCVLVSSQGRALLYGDN